MGELRPIQITKYASQMGLKSQLRREFSIGKTSPQHTHTHRVTHIHTHTHIWRHTTDSPAALASHLLHCYGANELLANLSILKLIS